MVMTTVGLNAMRDWFGSQLNAAPTHMAIGEGGLLIDNFDSYISDAALQAVWTTNQSTVTRDVTTPKQGLVTCVWTTVATPISNPYTQKTIASVDWTPYEKLSFWFKTPDATKDHYVRIQNNAILQSFYDFKSQLYNNAWVYVEIPLADTGWTRDDVEFLRFSVDMTQFTASTVFYIDDINVFSPAPSAADTTIGVELTRVAFESVDMVTSQQVAFTVFLPSTDVPTLNKVLRRMGITNTVTLNAPTVFTQRAHADILKTNAIDVSYTIQFRIQEVD